MRKFKSGATRDDNTEKPDFEGCLNPLVLEAYAKYMHKHCKQANGELRASDNWQKGIPKNVYIKSAWRHFLDVWKEHRGYKSRDGMIDAIMGLIFNIMGYAYEILKEDKKGKRNSDKKI